MIYLLLIYRCGGSVGIVWRCLQNAPTSRLTL